MGNDEIRDDIVDIDLSPIQKKKFRINGDNNKILMLNVSDVGVLSRYQESVDKIKKILEDSGDKQLELSETEDVDAMINRTSEYLAKKNKELCEIVDYIFDSNVSEVCCDGGTMFDPINGQYRLEYIIETILKLYDNNFDEEYKKIRDRVDKHTSKYKRKK